MIGIIAVNNLNFIGKDNKLMWHSSDDLKHFKAVRQGRKMIVGYNTYQELPNVLKKENLCIVDERNKLYQDIIIKNEDGTDKIVPLLCIGGKKTYEKYCHLFTELHISHINDDQEGDVKMPDWGNLNPECKVYHYSFEVNK